LSVEFGIKSWRWLVESFTGGGARLIDHFFALPFCLRVS
jgi:hypothetical protein